MELNPTDKDKAVKLSLRLSELSAKSALHGPLAADVWQNEKANLEEEFVRPSSGEIRTKFSLWINEFGEDLQLRREIVDAKSELTTERLSSKFEQIRRRFDKDISGCSDLIDIGVSEVNWKGRKSGLLTLLVENWLKPAPPEIKPIVGKEINSLRTYIESQLEKTRANIEETETESNPGRVDLSLPGIEQPLGTRHLISQTYQELFRIFMSIGFSVVEGPEIETPYYNFEALNIPEHHPARDDMDTFYIANLPGAAGAPGYLLRTHTSPMQARTLETQKPPLRIIVPGKVYRRDNPDATHSFIFHQLEGLAVDTDITFCDFRGAIEYFAREFFGPKTRVRLRPSYFPFTEPSAEFDASCHVCGGAGCRTCKHSGWIEMFGAGMVNPAVYKLAGYDPKRYSGFAFGLGVDRLAMLKYGIDDVQQFFRNDARFLRQFP